METSRKKTSRMGIAILNFNAFWNLLNSSYRHKRHKVSDKGEEEEEEEKCNM